MVAVDGCEVLGLHVVEDGADIAVGVKRRLGSGPGTLISSHAGGSTASPMTTCIR